MRMPRRREVSEALGTAFVIALYAVALALFAGFAVLVWRVALGLE